MNESPVEWRFYAGVFTQGEDTLFLPASFLISFQASTASILVLPRLFGGMSNA
ncbi:hypothetical protein [Rossellomorea aquimaris]|uniref:hypothetical protein n=1 Tax=Rossellomorea aquimaris TaxID=189382 RepID=UPI0015F012F8|nr:hypothetical protein [Rossellomorea aquimaris]